MSQACPLRIQNYYVEKVHWIQTFNTHLVLTFRLSLKPRLVQNIRERQGRARYNIDDIWMWYFDEPNKTNFVSCGVQFICECCIRSTLNVVTKIEKNMFGHFKLSKRKKRPFLPTLKNEACPIEHWTNLSMNYAEEMYLSSETIDFPLGSHREKSHNRFRSPFSCLLKIKWKSWSLMKNGYFETAVK